MTKNKPKAQNNNMSKRKNYSSGSSVNEGYERRKAQKLNKGSKKKFKNKGEKKEHYFNFGTNNPRGGEISASSPFSNDDNLFHLPKGRGIQNSLLNSEDSNFNRNERGDNNFNPNKRRKGMNSKKLGKSEAFNISPKFSGFGDRIVPWQNVKKNRDNDDDLENHPWITRPTAFINLTTSKPYFEEELNQLVEFIKPTSKELLARAWVIGKVVNILEQAFDNAKCLPFGSFTTQLLLPGSDVDLVLLSDDLKNKKHLNSALYKVRDILKRNGLLIKCEMVPKARIPLIKFTEPTTNVKVDICLNTITGIDSSKFTLLYSEEYPQLKWLTMVVKLLLDRLGLNEPATGGMGGYAIFLLGLSLIQVHDLGHLSLCDLLIKFLQYYGMTFNHEAYGIDFKVPGHYFSKRTSHLRLKYKDGMFYNRQLIIIDPNQENNIVSKATSKFDKIKNYFKLYYLQLSEKLDEINWKLNRSKSNINQSSDKSIVRIYSILKHWIKFSKFELNHRHHLKNVKLPDSQVCKKWIINNTDSFASTLNTSKLTSAFDQLPTNREEDKLKEFEFIVTSSDDEAEEAEQMEKAKQILNILSNPNLKTPKPIVLADEVSLRNQKKNEFWKAKGVKRNLEVIEIDSD